MAKTEKPSLAEAIKYGKAHCEMDNCDARVKHIRRLIEAAEFEKEFCKQAWWWRDRKCPNCPEKDRRIDRLKTLCKGLKWHSKRVFENFSELCVETCDLRSQLAEKEQELDKKDRRYEKMDEGYSHQIASQDIEIERLKDELDDLRFSTTPGFIKAMGRIDEGLTKGKLEIEKVRKVIKIIPEDSPTEAEVEKVAAKLHYQGYSKPSKAPTDWNGCAPTTKLRYRRRARHVIERGYRPEEE